MVSEASILSYFAGVEDPRKDKNRKHPLINIIGIAILGLIGGADNWVDIERYGRAKQAWLGTFLDLDGQCLGQRQSVGVRPAAGGGLVQ
jgi:hypothetical protein